ncbi:Na+/H+ antiporter NhaA [Prevotella bivia]|uniref:Na(+)/H(+) antiporter NhaA n=1 Tax=Prevotella bivia DSM 20514 TaxID=868129 RepID=I4ZAA4_9BACT|nr:Na+/H+ antiporter NhaA [Prevotella bivia]EFB93048.1 Na+/H+ antiporter NhaA [Prevotella bivia JCVIHMP010]EIM33146.1 Na+/H+ antiporter NhaA [Prevotella bivia DSM 20514]KGF37891.1 Na(+)/H(+) antiporter NhaA [Prevotella bivia DNF00650]
MDTFNRKIFLPAMQFMRQEKSGGIVLAVAVVIALALANSPWHENFAHFFEHHLGFVVDSTPYFNFSIAHWINDGLMSLFFFVVGLELKREFIGGELRDIRKVVLPVGAAIMGMLVPAGIFLALNFGTEVSGGWGIPMATDIAFALALVYMLGDRVPLSAKVFLTTLAIVDDLGSVIVIALFYTSNISVSSIAVGVAFLLIMFIANKMGVKSVLFYGMLGVCGVWTAFLMSGIHATIAAVLAAFMIPADSKIPEATFIARMRRQLRLFEKADSNDVRTLEHEQVEIIAQVKSEAINALPPLQRLEHGMHPFVSFVIMPIFALANAGVNFVEMDMASIFSNNVALGVMLGLLLGKPIGVVASVWILVKLGIGKRSASMTWRRFIGLGFLASIGFTMSMFVTSLAFTDPVLHVQAKVGIFAASILGGVIGYRLLKTEPAKPAMGE